jgi:hypothetical protein
MLKLLLQGTEFSASLLDEPIRKQHLPQIVKYQGYCLVILELSLSLYKHCSWGSTHYKSTQLNIKVMNLQNFNLCFNSK